MDWTETVKSANRRPVIRMLDGQVDTVQELQLAFEDVAKEISRSLASAGNTVYDVLRIEVWHDSGSVILYPHNTMTRRRTDVVCVEIRIVEMQRDYEFAIGMGDHAVLEHCHRYSAAISEALQNAVSRGVFHSLSRSLQHVHLANQDELDEYLGVYSIHV